MREIYKIEGLDCANCAKKVEEHLNKSPNIEHASLDFVNSKLFIDYITPMEEVELAMYIAQVNRDAIISKNQELDTNIKILSKKNINLLIRIIISAFITIVALCLPDLNKVFSIIKFSLYLLAYIIVSYDVIFAMFKNIFTGSKNIFDENFLMSVSTVGAFIIGSYFEGVLVMLLSQVGDILQEAAVNKSRRAILKTLDLRPTTANKLDENKNIKIVDPKELQVGDTILVKMGEIIPIDGVVLEGSGIVDTSSITGEFLPREVAKGSEVVSGCVLKSDSLIIKVSKTYTNSTISKILELVSNSGANKSKAEKFITKFAKIYTPVVLGIALIVGIVPPLFVGNWVEYIYRALIFLVISCPCAIIISVPLTYFTGLGLSAKNGIMIKGANYLDELCKTSKIVLDKTGTLTYGKFFVEKIVNKEIDEEKFLKYVAYAESISNHPIAKSIVEAYGKEINKNKIKEAEEKAGFGVKVKYDGKLIIVGSPNWLKKYNIKCEKTNEFGSIVHLAVDQQYCGYLVLKDKVKENAKRFISQMSQSNIETIMLTGDVEDSAQIIAKELDIKNYYSELLPEDKYKILNEIKSNNSKATVFVGDGVNDAPSIISADVGIAMGAMGSDVAVDSADVVIMNDEIQKVAEAITIAKSTRKKAIFNIAFSLIIKFVVMILSMIGLSSMGLAVFADVGVMLLLILNSLLLFKKKIK